MSTVPVPTAFGDPDAGDSVAGLVDYLDGATGVARVLAGKRARAALLTPVPGLRVLDVGCGTGDSLRLLAERVDPGGSAVGVDVSSALLDVGRERAGLEGWSAEWVHADAAALPFDDGEFDGCLVERVLQHVDSPQAVVAETLRVTRPGGTVVIAEPDWSSLLLDAGPVAVRDAVAAAVGRGIRHREVGRSLRRLLVDAGFVDVEVDAEVHVSGDVALVRDLALVDQAVADLEQSGELDRRVLQEWTDVLEADARAGRFTGALTIFVARGQVPTP
ncbi:MAG TPA: methyltransferase domain-containing protein [Marmoricola sp.]|nr:methyltransferase domain-containing protein [Marmoricola sp.]